MKSKLLQLILFGFSKVFSNTQEENKKNKLSMDNTMKKCEHRQLK